MKLIITCCSLIASYSSSLGYDPNHFRQEMSGYEADRNARVEFKFGCSSKSAISLVRLRRDVISLVRWKKDVISLAEYVPENKNSSVIITLNIIALAYGQIIHNPTYYKTNFNDDSIHVASKQATVGDDNIIHVEIYK